MNNNLEPLQVENLSHRSHPHCWKGDHYEHVCQQPSGRTCAECDKPAGTWWGPYWCPEHDVERLDRIDRQMEAIQKELSQ